MMRSGVRLSSAPLLLWKGPVRGPFLRVWTLVLRRSVVPQSLSIGPPLLLDPVSSTANTCTMTQVRKARRPATPRQAASCCGPVDRFLDPALFKAFSDPTRVSLVACIAKCGRACSVGEVAECCSVDFSVVSRHLALLARAGVLEATKQGRSVSYRVRYADVCRSLRELADALEECCPEKGGGCHGGCC